jgi:starch synthase
MRILRVSSEATPFAKSGGLADVVGSLPVALQELGHEVAVVMPRYRQIPWAETQSAYDNLILYAGPHPYRVDLRTLVHRGIRFYFVEAPYFYDREGLYNWRGQDFWDNHRRFLVLCLAALGAAQTVFRPDLIHCHDWQGALTPVYLADQQYANPLFAGVKTVLTIHNLGYQGRFGRGVWPDFGLNDGWMATDKLEYFGDVNCLKGGIVMADWLTTVSPTYAKEIQTPEGGFGLDGVLRSRAGALTGILNGADYAEWNPETDHFLPAHFSAADLSGKWVCKQRLCEEFGLDASRDRPLIGIVSRFAEQKGFDLIAGLAHLIEEEDLQLIVLGSGDLRYERLFNEWQRWQPRKVGVWIGYNNRLSHLIQAGADMFLMPSAYEPCGLNQMYCLRYGTTPIVRATGGLEDTIRPETGFKFQEYSPAALEGAIREALAAWRARDAWTHRMRTGMAEDFSWNASARHYSDLFQYLTGRS